MFNFYKLLKFNAIFRRRRRLVAVIIVIIIILTASSYIFFQLTVPRGENGALIKFTIRPGDSAAVVASQLNKQKLIRSALAFRLFAQLTGRDNKFKSGDYYLLASASSVTIMKIITGELVAVPEITLRFREGWTLQDIKRYLLEQGITTESEFTNLLQTKSGVADLLKDRDKDIFSGAVKTGNLEGYLFPDTYRFRHDVKLTAVVHKMLDNFTNKIQTAYREVSANAPSRHEVLTLASIVEKEVSSNTDRALLADIFWRRLKISMALQADSTINYITGKKVPAVSLEDLTVNSPYNTYRYPGLPPGPISNPSLASLIAVLNPQANEYWYFLTTPAGQVIYSRTFAEHAAAKQKYLR